MRKLIAGILFVFVSTWAGAALAADVKLGVVFGYTGPIESLTPQMAAGAELAMKEVSDSGALLGGAKVISVRADSTCGDSAAGSAATERIVTSDKVNAIVGGDCSGVTTAMLKNVAKPNGIVMISPSATSPSLSTIEDDGLFFRTAPSDARQGAIIADILKEMGVKEAALTYTNNDYGKGLADSIAANVKKGGGKITISAPHEDGKGDYSAEVAALAAAGGDILIVAGYADQGGKGIIQGALDTGAFDKFYLPDGMISDSLVKAIGKGLEGAIGAHPGTDSPGTAKLGEIAKAAKVKSDSPFVPESYDAAALIMLAMQAAKSAESGKLKDKVMMVANAPGEKIYPGELAKGLKILAGGGDVDYVGASAVELIGPGESAGNYRQIVIKDGKIATVKYR